MMIFIFAATFLCVLLVLLTLSLCNAASAGDRMDLDEFDLVVIERAVSSRQRATKRANPSREEVLLPSSRDGNHFPETPLQMFSPPGEDLGPNRGPGLS